MSIPGAAGRLLEEIITTAATISPRSDVVILKGTTGISRITPPGTGGVNDGVVTLIPVDGAVGLLATGNIALAATIPQNKLITLVYSISQGKWYGSI